MSRDISILLKFSHFKVSCDLENEVKVTTIQSGLKLVQVLHLCKCKENPTFGSRDILHTIL